MHRLGVQGLGPWGHHDEERQAKHRRHLTRNSFPLRETTDPTHYPLVLVSYLITCVEFTDAEAAPLVQGYLTYLTSVDGQAEAAASAGAAPLSEELSASVAKALATIK